MAPKRRPLDPTTRPKNAKKPRQVVSYDSFEEALDAGVVQEEKGERYRVGDKAMRHYEEAVKLYELAISLDPSAFEGHYNLARVLYHLSTSFHLPPTSFSLLSTSISHSRLSLTLTSSPQLLCDSSYNLSEALLSLAEFVEDTEDGREAEVEGWRREAVAFLEVVAGKQEEMIVAQSEREGTVGGVDDGEGEGDVEMGMGDEEEEAAPVGDEEEEEGGDAGGASSRVWEETVTTPSLYLDTLLSLLTALLLLPLSPTPPLLPSTLSKLQSLSPLCTSSGTPRDYDILIAEATVRLALLRLAFDASPSQQGWEDEARKIIAVLEAAWETVKNVPTTTATASQGPTVELETKVSLVAALGDAQSLLARLLRIQLLQPASWPITPARSQPVWSLLTASTTSSNLALSLLTPPPSAFPSSTTPDPATSSILLTMSTLSLLRANLSLPPFSYPSAVTNRVTLLNNAGTYAKRAVDASGSSFASTSSSSSLGKACVVGWEKERMGRDAVLGSWRVGFWKGDYSSAQGGVEELVKGASRRGMRRMDVSRFLEELREEEGGLMAEEEAFWNGVGGVLS